MDAENTTCSFRQMALWKMECVINRITSSQDSMLVHQLQVCKVNLIYEMLFHELNIKTLFIWTNKNLMNESNKDVL